MQVDVGRIRDAKGASITAAGTVDLTNSLDKGVRPIHRRRWRSTVTNTGRFLHVEGKFTTGIRAECVRCLGAL